MYITWQTIITAGAVLAAVLAIGGVIFKVYKWYLHQGDQDKIVTALQVHHEEDMKQVREENTLICYALSACLDGLMQLGCNHTVPDAKSKLDKYLNQQAHK
jgi:hypothetical protein